MALTVGDVAALIGRDGADRAAIIQRLRVWTASGLLECEGDLNPGTGRERHYSETAVYTAALLNALTDLGLPIGRQRLYVRALHIAECARQRWVSKTRVAGSPLYLEVANCGEPRAVFLHGDKQDHCGNTIMHPQSEASLLINVSKLFGRIEEGRAAS
jgi:hypothetical protein